MMSAPDLPGTFRFQDFELDLGAYELRHQGGCVRMERRPMELLILLVERRGQLVSRAEIVERLWGPDVFVEVETGINTVVRKVRQALGDSPDAPKFVETVPGKGYRFIAQVEIVEARGGHPTPAAPTPAPSGSHPEAVAPGARLVATGTIGRPVGRTVTMLLVLAAILASLALWNWRRDGSPRSQAKFVVLPFTNIGNAPEREYLADALTEETTTALDRIEPEHFVVIARTSTARYKGTSKTVAEIGGELGADYVVESSIQQEGAVVRIHSSLIRVADQTRIWSNSYDYEPRASWSCRRSSAPRSPNRYA